MPNYQPEFEIITGKFIREILATTRNEVIEIVKKCYLIHHHRKTENPDSYFLRFKDKPDARIIALPAAINDGEQDLVVSGIKWIASYPKNTELNLQRASAVMVLNNYCTGYPFACLEASQISAARTAASAVLAARHLWNSDRKAKSLSIIGAGVIAYTILNYFRDDGWNFDSVFTYDLSPQHRSAFIYNSRHLYNIRTADRDEALEADIVVFATTAGTPWVPPTHRFKPHQLVLNISLRDIAPETLVECNNVLDDINHCLKANTSPHLAEQKYRHRNFITGSLAEIIEKEKHVDANKATIFSPFGLGILDLSLAMFIYRQGIEMCNRTIIQDFFPDMRRWVDNNGAPEHFKDFADRQGLINKD